jgi:hypothetical protein
MNPVKIKYQPVLVLMVLFTACNGSGNKTTVAADTLPAAAADSSTIMIPVSKKGDILDTLNAFAFVQEASRNIDSVTGHKSSIAYIIDTTPSKYNITAGYNGEERFETYFQFSVDKITRAITVEDVISGETLTPEAFEKRRRSKQ